MVGIYFSGTGNTKYCVTEYVNFSVSNGRVFSIEDAKVKDAFISEEDENIILGYPSINGEMPSIMKTFLDKNKESFKGRTVLIIVTMAKLGGDAAGKTAKLLKSYGANIMGSIHLKMPDTRTDTDKRFTSIYQNQKFVEEAKVKIHNTVIDIKRGKYPNDGQSFADKLAGALTKGLTKGAPLEVNIDTKKCNKCLICVNNCPTKNIVFQASKIKVENQCTLCYRCVNICPRKAITILGKEIEEQSVIEKYINKESDNH